jgi:hypothetical protein
VNYEALCSYAGEQLADPMPTMIRIGSGEAIPDVSVAVYVAVGVEGQVLYVGSVSRPQDPGGVRRRLAEHRRRLDRLNSWDGLYLIPLRTDTPLDEVRRIEGRVGAHLRPASSRALPRLRKRS